MTTTPRGVLAQAAQPPRAPQESATGESTEGARRAPGRPEPLAPRTAAPDAAAALRPRALLPAQGNSGPGGHPAAARPDPHDIDPPARQAVPPAAVANNALPVGGAAPGQGLRLLALGRLAGAAGLVCFLAERVFPDRGLDKATVTFFGVGVFLVWLESKRRTTAANLRRSGLQGLPLARVIKIFCAPDSAAGRFDWSVPGLFVDTMGRDMAGEVSHILARAFAAAGTPRGAAIRPALSAYADDLATDQNLRADLAKAVSEANSTCEDRVGVRLGELILMGTMRQAHHPATAPRKVVGTLVLHAATRDLEDRILELLHQDWIRQGHDPEKTPPQPEAELMLAGFQALQSALARQGIAVPQVFPRRLYETGNIGPHLADVEAAVAEIVEACCRPAEPGQPPGQAVVAHLEQHGGEAVDEILSHRLAHLTEPLTQAAQRELQALEAAGGGRMNSQQYQDAAAKVQRDYREAVSRVRAAAITGALSGQDALWRGAGQREPSGHASTASAEPAWAPGETSADAQAQQVPAGLDPDKGKWKVI